MNEDEIAASQGWCNEFCQHGAERRDDVKRLLKQVGKAVSGEEQGSALHAIMAVTCDLLVNTQAPKVAHLGYQLAMAGMLRAMLADRQPKARH